MGIYPIKETIRKTKDSISGLQIGKISEHAVALIIICKKDLFMVLFEKFIWDVEMPRKAKTAISSDLPSWVDSRQEQGLYFFTREEAISNLKFTEEAFKKAAARLAKKNRILRIRSGFFSRQTSMQPLLLKSRFKRGIFPSPRRRLRLLISSVMQGQLVDWIA